MHLIKLYLFQSFFRSTLQDCSVSSGDVHRTAIFYLSIFWTIQFLLLGEAVETFLASISELVLTWVFIFIALALARRRHLFLPVAALTMGAEGLIGLLAIPVIVWLRIAEGPALLVAFYSLILFALWGLAVLGHVFHQALARPTSFGFGVACAYAVETYLGTLMLLVL
ncbi:MAG: hypothetical protein N3A55_09720 [Methylohalobius sp.]|nr:hypothetical protein [Methylohalobius sp.]